MLLLASTIETDTVSKSSLTETNSLLDNAMKNSYISLNSLSLPIAR